MFIHIKMNNNISKLIILDTNEDLSILKGSVGIIGRRVDNYTYNVKLLNEDRSVKWSGSLFYIGNSIQILSDIFEDKHRTLNQYLKYDLNTLKLILAFEKVGFEELMLIRDASQGGIGISKVYFNEDDNKNNNLTSLSYVGNIDGKLDINDYLDKPIYLLEELGFKLSSIKDINLDNFRHLMPEINNNKDLLFDRILSEDTYFIERVLHTIKDSELAKKEQEIYDLCCKSNDYKMLEMCYNLYTEITNNVNFDVNRCIKETIKCGNYDTFKWILDNNIEHINEQNISQLSNILNSIDHLKIKTYLIATLLYRSSLLKHGGVTLHVHEVINFDDLAYLIDTGLIIDANKQIKYDIQKLWLGGTNKRNIDLLNVIESSI